MPIHPGILFSTILLVGSLATNIVMYPQVGEMLSKEGVGEQPPRNIAPKDAPKAESPLKSQAKPAVKTVEEKKSAAEVKTTQVPPAVFQPAETESGQTKPVEARPVVVTPALTSNSVSVPATDLPGPLDPFASALQSVEPVIRPAERSKPTPPVSDPVYPSAKTISSHSTSSSRPRLPEATTKPVKDIPAPVYARQQIDQQPNRPASDLPSGAPFDTANPPLAPKPVYWETLDSALQRPVIYENSTESSAKNPAIVIPVPPAPWPTDMPSVSVESPSKVRRLPQ